MKYVDRQRSLPILFCLLFCLLCGAPRSFAGVIFYTDRDAFLAQVAPDYHLEDFSLTPGGQYNGLEIAGGAYRYTMHIYDQQDFEKFVYVRSYDDFVIAGSLSGYNHAVIQFGGNEGSGNIYAFGAYVFCTGWNGSLYPGADITFILPGGESYALSSIENTTTFLGFISDEPLTSLRVDASFLDYLQFRDPIVAAIPEPSAPLVLYLGGAILLCVSFYRTGGFAPIFSRRRSMLM